MNTYYTYTQRRDRDFLAACSAHMQRMQRAGKPVKHTQVVALALATEAPQFYVSVEYVLHRLRQPVDYSQQRTASGRRLACIQRRVAQAQAADAHLTTAEAVRRVLSAPAPCFYMSTRQARAVFLQHFAARRTYVPVTDTARGASGKHR